MIRKALPPKAPKVSRKNASVSEKAHQVPRFLEAEADQNQRQVNQKVRK